MAALHAISPHGPLPLSKTKRTISKNLQNSQFLSPKRQTFSRNKQRWHLNSVVQEELDVIPVRSGDSIDHQEGMVASPVEREGADLAAKVSGFGGSDGQFSFEGFSSASSSCIDGESIERQLESGRLIDRTINAMIVLGAGTYAITKLLTIDHNYWHGWTLFEILRYAPQHNWSAYEEALKKNPVLAKMMISGIVYSLGDWIAQCYEGKPLFEYDRTRMFRSGLVGFTLHGSLSHYYYQFCEELFPFQDWWVVPAIVAFDQTLWAATWNSIYFTVLGFLRLESPASIFSELTATFWPMLTAGWKLWPFAHLITYGVIPVEQRLLWVDCVELIWVTILSTYSNEKSEARLSEAAVEASSSSLPSPPEE
ncbi:PEROXISOMAL MEMBRANE PROTEIN 2 PXMP2 MPV17 [Salix koriyanagi]|uniref:PEROXISOMAL MEMBRANE PROTEIN 2 PXMP2 MPV17 n=1 Tax=Salix koriyanagi TaxID=2511006 RepID=A0A9Q1AM02_9ROSI|nr:PEROXISOMAL MEMBRANE PROTEIN 2 PXMP2 MPV17 [Salix koriyanagi]